MLQWQSIEDIQNNLTFKEALNYAKKMNKENYIEHSDWRVPTIKELISLVNDKDMPITGFWSSSPDTYYSNHMWFVYFYYGLVYGYDRNCRYAVRLVRDMK